MSPSPAPPSPPSSLHTHFTEPTTLYWQNFFPSTSSPPRPPFRFSYPVTLPDGRILLLPIRPLPIADTGAVSHAEISSGDKDPDKSTPTGERPRQALASLLVNHASIDVTHDLCANLGLRISEFLESTFPGTATNLAGGIPPQSMAIVAVPTLGLTVAPAVANALRFTRYVPLGYSRKFWYDDAMSVEVASVTSPGTAAAGSRSSGGTTIAAPKRVFLDPNLLQLLRGKHVILIDDTVSSGRTLKAVWDFLEGEGVGCKVVAAGVLMKQGVAWRGALGEDRAGRVVGVLESPLLRAVEGGWLPE